MAICQQQDTTISLQVELNKNLKSVDRTALAELKEVSDLLIVTSTQKKLPVTGLGSSP
jgi:hypothetical protein